ncbi:MAG: hypothetical protein H6Q26_1411 [Bacteroidetes bacterium]|nr:hypothetical protein [Bacteroidota bacterium]
MQPVTRLGVGIGCLHRDQARLQAGWFEPAGLLFLKWFSCLLVNSLFHDFLYLRMNKVNTNIEE